MKRTILFFSYLTCCLPIVIIGQSAEHQWARTAGGNGVQATAYIDNTPSNGVVTTGYFQDTVDFDPGPGVNLLYSGTGFFDSKPFVQKLNANGELEWAYGIDGVASTKGIHVDGLGNTMVWGEFSGSVDFDPGPGSLVLTSGYTSTNSPASAVWINKIDSSGNLIWAKHFTGSEDIYVSGFVEDPQGNIYLTGQYRGADIDFDPGSAVVQMPMLSNQPMYILKLDSLGDFIWVKQMEGTEYAYGIDLASDATGNIYLLCLFEDSLDVDLGPGRDWKVAPPSVGLTVERGIAYVKMNGEGGLIWSGYTDSYFLYDGRGRMQVNTQNELVFIGHLRPVASVIYDTIDVDPGPGILLAYPLDGVDAFVHKLDSNGNLAWRYPLTGPSSQFLHGLDLDEQDNIYFSGITYDNTDFDPGPGSSTLPMTGSHAGFLGKLDVNGNFSWVQSAAERTTSYEPSSIAVNSNQNIFWGGIIFDDNDLDPGTGVDSVYMAVGPEALWAGDAVVARWLFCPGDTVTDSVEVCIGSDYTFPDGTLQTNVQAPISYTSTLNAVGACDTTIVTRLSVIPVNISISSTTNSITANASNASFQWLDCGMGFAPISGATSSSFQTSATGSFAVEITQNGCQDTSICTNLNPTGTETEWESMVEVFPNPTTGKLKVRMDQPQNGLQVSITNPLGQVVYNKSYQNEVNTLSMHLVGPKGIFFLRLRNTNGEEVRFPVLKQ